MSFFKIILALLVLVLAVVGVVALLGVVAALFKWLVILGVIALAGVGAYKLLSKPDEPRLELTSAEAEMLKAEQMLADIRRKQLTKRSEEHTSELQSRSDLVCRLLLEKKKNERRRHAISLRRCDKKPLPVFSHCRGPVARRVEMRGSARRETGLPLRVPCHRELRGTPE